MKKEKKYDVSGRFLTPKDDGSLFVRQATIGGGIICPIGAVFDASYPTSPYRRSRVQSNTNCTGCLTAGESQVYLYEQLKEIEL